ncbi:MAG: glucose-6-phosphate isomerase [Rhizobiales bacterium]|nr:glucose-6-phosphate isomerase [Hyphomicrobiales bacterium]MBO6699311.1 glucose-6-phosphate isomerase [Hyphomicrobiales bacterium]MBO6736849.1 glucose-6-phosphate isomerase [Hyphomicrobiales bacterium]MBO6912077.1 glucose-6-phosphate isomerase [Hyphomicrobiales bacterium]MBO6954555.1 glucose-6-phosphate isomerase [Hyphomicrobiales bacterium]
MSEQTSLSDLLAPHAERMAATHLRSLLQDDLDRFSRFSRTACGVLIDWSKEKLDEEAWHQLLTLAQDRDVTGMRDAMLRGDPINATENRAVRHTALRGGEAAPSDVRHEIAAEKSRFLLFAEGVRSGAITASDGEPFTHVINIGIGGSDLGPAMAVRALAPFCDGPQVHFLSNVDGAHATDVLKGLDPQRTLVLVASKTFTTLETLTNAETVRAWLVEAVGEEGVGGHLAALSTNAKATKAFGIDEARVFGFWDYVGGRYSLWSAIGLPLAIAIGADRFEAFLAGAHAMDLHFAEAPLADNLPAILALIGVWRRNGQGLVGHAVIPYEERLARFPAYLQQMDMESNGKRVRIDGTATVDATGMLVFGEPGTNAQHSFFQLFHQGHDVVGLDVLVGTSVVGEAVPGRADVHHTHLLANALAQTRALALGRTLEETRAEMVEDGIAPNEIDRLAPHRTFPGDRPSTTIVYDHLDPETLGKLIALYEHKVFVESVLWGINAFDQWGVELGKQLAKQITPALSDRRLAAAFDPSTRGLIEALLDKD